MDPRDRNESSNSARSSLGLLRSDAISELSGISGYESSGFVALATEEEEEAAEGDLEEEEEVFDDFEPTPVAYSSQTFSSKSIETPTPVGLPAKLLVPSESTPNTPTNTGGLPPPVHRLLQNIVTAVNSGDLSADNSRLSWDKIFGNHTEKETPSFCTGQFSARSTSFGTTNSSSSSKDECTQNERFSDYMNPPSVMMSNPNSIQSNYSTKDSPFGGGMSESGCFFDNLKFEEQKEKQEGFEKEEFRSLDSNFIDEAEKENKDKFRFIQEQTMSSDVTSATGSKLGFSTCLNNTNASAMLTEDQLSRSQYFMMNTSRLGNSICNATDDSSRPNLGFETIKSPKLKPKPLLEKTNPSIQQISTSQTNSTYTLSDVSSASSVENGNEKSASKKLTMVNNESSMSMNDSKALEQVLKSKLSSDGQLDLNFISMLMNNSADSSSNSDDKKGSAEYLVSMILKTLEASGTQKKSSSFDMSCVSGALPSFLEMSSTSASNDSTSNISSKTLPSKSRKRSSGTRHSSPIRSQSLSRNEQRLKIQPINSVIKSSKSIDNDPNVSIVVMEQLKKNYSPCQLQVLTREGDRIDFGILPEDCSTMEDLVLVHNGQHDQEIRLEIQGQLPSFIYPTDGQTRYIKIISSKNIILTLPAISLSTTKESVACSIKISIHTPASGSDELKTLHSQINIICEGKLLAQVPMVARVGQAKLQTLKSNKIPILNCSPNGTWFEHSIPMMNFGNIQMTISLSIASSSLGIFKMDQNVMILQPKKEYHTHFKFYPQDVGEEECILRCTVQPNGTTYEVPIKICSRFTKDEDKENALKFPVVQLGKLPTSAIPSSPLRKSSLGESNNKKISNTPAKEGFVFPVEADKSFINWISVPVGTSEEQILTLKNALPDAIAVTLVVRESNLFRVKINELDEYKRSADIPSLPGYGTISIKVAFQPTTLLKKNGDKIDLGKLIIKPRLGAGGKIYKATITLQGNTGAPEFTFSGFGDEVNGKQSLFLGQLSDKLIIKTLSIRNKGSGPGFCSCLALGNNGAKSDAISFENQDSIVLYPNESSIFRFTVDPRKVPMGDKNQVFVGFIHVYYGPELARSAMRKALHKLSPSLKLTYEASTFGNGVVANFDTDYKGECESFSGLTSHLDVKSFYKNVKRMVVELSGITFSKEESLIKFNALPVEETLSESRMDNTNYNSTLFVTQPHSPPTRCPPILEEQSTSVSTGKVFEIHDEEIFIESRKTVLVTLINVTRDTQGFDLGWPAHILMVQPSSGVVAPSQRETIAITAIAQERRKGSISVYSTHNQESHQSISFHVLPLKFTVEPDKIKFAHPGTEMNVTLKNHTEQRLQWEVKDIDPNFLISLKKGYLLSKGSIDFTVLFRPNKVGVHFEKAICFTGKTEGSVGEVMSAILEVSGGQVPSHIPVPLQSIVSSNKRSDSELQQEPGTKKTVYLDKESISFPPTKVGEHSVLKVIVKNRLNAAQTFNVEALSSPFSTKYHETSIVIKPMSYLGFPVTFAPLTKGEFKQNIVLKNNHKILVGILMGSSE